MSKKAIYGTLGLIALVAAVVMKIVGKQSSHLSELQEFWWYPLPIAFLCFLGAVVPDKRKR